MIQRWIDHVRIKMFLSALLRELEDRVDSHEDSNSDLLRGRCDYYKHMIFCVNACEQTATSVVPLIPAESAALDRIHDVEAWKEGWRITSLALFDWIRKQKYAPTAMKRGLLFLHDYHKMETLDAIELR